MPVRTRIAVIDDHPLFREGVVCTLRGAADMEVVGEGATAAEAIRICESHAPDIILLDLYIPGGGIEAAREIRQRCMLVKTVMLTVSDNDRHVADALQSDINGYVLKGISGADLLHIIRAVQNCEPYTTPCPAVRFLAQTRRPVSDTGDRSKDAALTYREEEVLQLLLQGLTNKVIAHRLGITEPTIKYHITGLLQKLKARNRLEAVLVARKRMGSSAYASVSASQLTLPRQAKVSVAPRHRVSVATSGG